ncbi:hypothetical protein [Actinomadura montaniterrae]|uniref:Uncharacterized protein n=1 Tax=Actinomadura montaniterrae TaxID=1803903 RepID=A0A6L3VMZ9_9ACTN|nr:hypothetical protein [Actinomadura montaniterrae]KAB2374838.1 hypothetical protein F9B16_27055 [Actinomadura montaniterrae]
MPHSRFFVTGLALAGLLGLGDLATWLFGVGGDGQPPAAAAAVITAIGAVTLAGAVLAWRGRRGGLIAVLVTRILSALATVPAFGDDGVSTANLVLLAAGLVLTAAAIVLLWPSLRRPAATTP